LQLDPKSRRDDDTFLSAVSEFILSFILNLPTSPAVINFISGMHATREVTGPYAVAAARFGVPVASVRAVLSYPDSPRFQLQLPEPRYEVWSAENANEEPIQLVAPITIKDGSMLRPRPHTFTANWGPNLHPSTKVHVLMAETLFYFTRVLVSGADAMVADPSRPCDDSTPTASKYPAPSAALGPRDGSGSYGFSPWAAKVQRFFDPTADCPDGMLKFYDAKEQIAGNSWNGVQASERNASNWRLKEDRFDKFGWIIDAGTGDDRDVIEFPVLFHVPGGRLTVEYLTTYENAGRVEVSLHVDWERSPGVVEAILATASPVHDGSGTVHGSVNLSLDGDEALGPLLLGPRGNKVVVLDAFVPSVHHSTNTVVRLYPTGLKTKDMTTKASAVVTAMLRVRRLPIASEGGAATADKRRARGRFKIASVGSC